MYYNCHGKTAEKAFLEELTHDFKLFYKEV